VRRPGLSRLFCKADSTKAKTPFLVELFSEAAKGRFEPGYPAIFAKQRSSGSLILTRGRPESFMANIYDQQGAKRALRAHAASVLIKLFLKVCSH